MKSAVQSRHRVPILGDVMEEYETEPAFELPRIDGGKTYAYRSLTDPTRFRIEWDGCPNNWTDYFQAEMRAGNVKK